MPRSCGLSPLVLEGNSIQCSIFRNGEFLSDLFSGPFRGHAIIPEPDYAPVDWLNGDLAVSELPVKDWVPLIVERYEARVKWHEALGDDAVPFASIWTGTEIFAAAFGSPVHVYEDSPPCALPLVTSAEEADKLQTPDLSARPMERVFELGHLLREELGADVPIGVPDIQSPFDVAALIWRKEDLFVALCEEPDSVKRLTGKCYHLLRTFLSEFKSQFPNCNLCTCPYAWAPTDMGCWLAEDEVGMMSPAMFEGIRSAQSHKSQHGIRRDIYTLLCHRRPPVSDVQQGSQLERH